MIQEKISRARELNDLIRERTRDQVITIIAIGEALKEMYNDDLWPHLGYRSWSDYCGRAADLSVQTADRYIDIAVTFGDLNLPDHEYVGITKLMYLRRIAISKPMIRKGLRVANDMTCEDFKSWVARESRKLRQKGYALRPFSERHTQLNLIFAPDEKKEYREILETCKEANGFLVNGSAALSMAKFWKKHYRKLAAA